MKKSGCRVIGTLQLHRETLQALEQGQLQGIAGGATAATCGISCGILNTCGSKYC